MIRYYVLAIPSNDERPDAGEKHAQRVARALHQDFKDVILSQFEANAGFPDLLHVVAYDPVIYDGHAPEDYEPKRGTLAIPLGIWDSMARPHQREVEARFEHVEVVADDGGPLRPPVDA